LVCVVALAASAAGTAGADVFNMPSGQTSLQFVTVGDPGNAADVVVMDDGTRGYGAVPYVYKMGPYSWNHSRTVRPFFSACAGG
jgi:hypothetical protein